MSNAVRVRPRYGSPQVSNHVDARIGLKLYKAGGLLMSSERLPGNPTGKGGGIRGGIEGWSLASRRRMRLFMLQHEFASGFDAYGVTITTPGPVLPPLKCSEMFGELCRERDERGHAYVWRAEVQRRGALHWHLLYGAPRCERLPADTVPEDRAAIQRELLERDILKAWSRVLDRHFPAVTLRRGRVGPLSNWPGFQGSKRPRRDTTNGGAGVVVQNASTGRGAWERYLQDHASKCKQHQIGEGIGRHWGVVGRKRFVEISGEMVDMTRKEYARFRRGLERLATPSRKDQESAFGRSLGRRCRRGRRGCAVAFTRPETLARLATWAKGGEA